MVDALKKKQTVTSTALRLGTFRLVISQAAQTRCMWSSFKNRKG